jgi:hypothetical protein
MTVAELQTIRTNILAALNGTLERGVAAYGLNGRNIQSMNPRDLFAMLSQVDLAISQAGSGMFYASQFRKPE